MSHWSWGDWNNWENWANWSNFAGATQFNVSNNNVSAQEQTQVDLSTSVDKHVQDGYSQAYYGYGGYYVNQQTFPAPPVIGFQVGVQGGGASDQLVIPYGAYATSGNAIMAGPNVVATFTGGVNGQPLVVSMQGGYGSNFALVAGLIDAVAYKNTSDTPPATRTIQYQIFEQDGSNSVDYVQVNIAPVNDAPVVAVLLADQSVAEDTAFAYTIPSGAFTDVDSPPASLTYSATLSDGAPLPSWMSFDAATRTVSGTPVEGSATVTVKVTAADGAGGSVSDIFVINVIPVNDAPVVAAPLVGAADEAAGLVTVNALAGASDPDAGATLSVTNLSPLPAGVSYDSAAKTFTLDPADAAFGHLAAGQAEVVPISYDITDGVISTPQTLTFTITGTNDGPVAVADTAAGTENQTLTIDVLANDTDLDDGATKTLVSVVAPAGKGLASAVDGKVAFDPGAAFDHLAAGATETVTLDYVMKDDQGVTSASAATVTITGTNDGPVAVADAASGTENQALTIDVLANDTDLDDGATRTLVSAAAPAGKGAASIVDGKVAFDPGAAFDHLAAGATETVTLGYVMKDDQGAISASAVTVTITGTNDSPIVSGPVTGVVTEDGPVSSLNGLASASDVDDGATLVVVNLPALPAGVSFDAASNSFRLNPADAAYQHLGLGQSQVVSVAYGVSDGVVTTSASASWTISGSNDGPVAHNDAGAVNEDASVTLNVLANDTDVDDGDSKTISAVGPTALGGHVTIVGGQLVYVADADAFDHLTPGGSLTDSFTYTMKDAAGLTSTATATVIVSGVADGASLVGGNKTQVLTGTALDESIAGGNADDTLYGNDGADELHGNNAKDLLYGGQGQDKLFGENGSDVLDGGIGNDTLTGGAGPDTFVFGANFGADVVTDFDNGDTLKFVGGFTTASQVLSHAAQVGANVVITSGADSILLKGVTLSSLSSGDFLFG